MTDTHLVVFKGKEIRRTLHKNEWWFAIADVVSVLTDLVDPTGYIKDMRRRDGEHSEGVGANCHPPFCSDGRRASKDEWRKESE